MDIAKFSVLKGPSAAPLYTRTSRQSNGVHSLLKRKTLKTPKIRNLVYHTSFLSISAFKNFQFPKIANTDKLMLAAFRDLLED